MPSWMRPGTRPGPTPGCAPTRVRRGAHGPRRRPKAGWDALTGTERRVAALLAEGLSNPQIAARMFTSRRTVQFHVSNILAKLGLSSRVELAALIAAVPGEGQSL